MLMITKELRKELRKETMLLKQPSLVPVLEPMLLRKPRLKKMLTRQKRLRGLPIERKTLNLPKSP